MISYELYISFTYSYEIHKEILFRDVDFSDDNIIDALLGHNRDGNNADLKMVQHVKQLYVNSL